MDVLFLRNPDTGEVRRFFAKPSIPHDGSETFEGWEVVDGFAWADANADHELVAEALARYNSSDHSKFDPEYAKIARERLATEQPATAPAGGVSEILARPHLGWKQTHLISVIEAQATDNATLRAQLAAAEATAAGLREALQPFAFCPIHPSWPDDTRCVILMNWNKPGLEVSINEGLKLGDVRKAVQAADAKPAGGA